MNKLQYSEKVEGSGKYNFNSNRQDYQWRHHFPLWRFYFGSTRFLCGIVKDTLSLNSRRENDNNCPICVKREKYLGWCYGFSNRVNDFRYSVGCVWDNFMYKIGL